MEATSATLPPIIPRFRIMIILTRTSSNSNNDGNDDGNGDNDITYLFKYLNSSIAKVFKI